MSFAKDPEIAAEWKKVTVKKAMNPCPIDFSEFHSSNPRPIRFKRNMMDRTIPTSIVAKNMLTTRNRSLRRPLVKDRVSFLWKRDGIVSFGPAIVRGLIGLPLPSIC